MKKARKKRIVRRKRRISEREIMRIKRKLKKSARKLRLGAKRTGAYVYGTLRRIVGNGMKTHNEQGQKLYVVLVKGVPLKYQPPFRPGIIYYTKGWAIKKARVFKGEVMSVANYMKYQRDTRSEAIRRGYMPKEYLSEAERRLLGNPYPTGGMTPLERLRYHVSGAIARGEAKPITDLSGLVPRKPKIVRVLGYDVVEGSKKHMRLLAQKRHFDDLQRGERGLRGNPSKNYYSELLRAGIPMDHHESDLYVMDTPEARRILSDWPFGRLERFRNNINGKIYIDVPFGYMPYWERKMRK